MKRRVQSWFKVRFITGFFVTVPVVLTAWVLWVFYREIDQFMAPVDNWILGRDVPGFGFLAAITIIFLIGVIATNVVGRRILQWGESLLLLRLPVFGRVYPAVKQLVEAFTPRRGRGFQEFVIVEHPREGIYAYGFRTGDVQVEGVEPELVTVYIPTNHLYLGDIVLVPRDSVIPTGLTIEEGIRVILSAGTAMPGRVLGPSGVTPGASPK